MKTQKELSDPRRFSKIREKTLDKIDDLLYNIRTEGKRMEYNKLEDTNKFRISGMGGGGHRFWSNLEATIKQTLSGYGEAYEKTGAKGTKPFIAGGLIRDYLLGYSPSDIDVFVPCPPDWDKDDFTVYLTENFRRITGSDRPYIQKGEGNYIQSGKVVYASLGRLGGLIWRVDVITTEEQTEEEVVSGFDHDLVKCYATGEGVFVSNAFEGAFKKKRVCSRNANTQSRLNDWKRRTGAPFVIGKPPKTALDTGSSHYTEIYEVKTAGTTQYRQHGEWRNVILQAGVNPAGEIRLGDRIQMFGEEIRVVDGQIVRNV